LTKPMTMSTTTAADGAVVLAIDGELETASAPLLSEAIAKAAASRPPEVRLDLSEVAFVDSTGLGTILAARAALAETSTLRIVGAHGHVARTFERAGLGRLLGESPGEG
jgi:anti-sigma B factor antagonist